MDNNKYTTPELEIIAFENVDVIDASDPVTDETDMGKWLS